MVDKNTLSLSLSLYIYIYNVVLKRSIWGPWWIFFFFFFPIFFNFTEMTIFWLKENLIHLKISYSNFFSQFVLPLYSPKQIEHAKRIHSYGFDPKNHKHLYHLLIGFINPFLLPSPPPTWKWHPLRNKADSHRESWRW
jgi:hypothetical protein